MNGIQSTGRLDGRNHWPVVFVVAALVLSAATAGASVTSYKGSLSYGSGLDASGDWADSATTISWDIVEDGGQWDYSYTFQVSAGSRDMSHALVETVPAAEKGTNVFDFQLDGQSHSDVDIGLQQSTSGTGYPEDIQAVKFNFNENGQSVTSHTMSFSSTIAPTWGDAYVKDGQTGGQDNVTVAAWNKGFTVDDSDPFGSPSDGSVENHVLAPATPEPGTTALALIAAAVGAFTIYRTRGESAEEGG